MSVIVMMSPADWLPFGPQAQRLAAAADVTLAGPEGDWPSRPAGLLRIRSEGEPAPVPAPEGVPSLEVILARPAGRGGALRFADSQWVPRVFRGRSLEVAEAPQEGVLAAQGEVLATIDGRPVWTSACPGGVRRDSVVVPEPWLAGETRVFEHAKGRHLMRILPLIEWLRHLSRWDRWVAPPPRACFMFDDPNLHAQRYGYLHFPSLAALARRHRFHVAFATVPLDQYWVSPRAARTFRASSDALSLLVHGVDHLPRELGSGCPGGDGIRRALQRIERLERRAGVEVARVMAPPHGAFSTAMMRACAAAGFEAACVSWGAIWSANRAEAWTEGLGAEPGRLVEGLTVLPRFRLARGIEGQVRLSAYLGQPIIPVGHHWDLGRDPDLLAHLARVINEVPGLIWQDTRRLARGQYLWRLEKERLEVRAFAPRLELDVPAGVREIVVEVPSGRWSGPTADEDEERAVSARTPDGKRLGCTRLAASSWVIETEGTPSCEVTLGPGPPSSRLIGQQGAAGPSWGRPFARRLLVEARDRAWPLLTRLRKSSADGIACS